MADSELGQVVTDCGGLVEAEVGCELQAIRGPQARNWGVDPANATVSTRAASGSRGRVIRFFRPADGRFNVRAPSPGFAGHDPDFSGESYSTRRSSTSERSTTGTWPPAR